MIKRAVMGCVLCASAVADADPASSFIAIPDGASQARMRIGVARGSTSPFAFIESSLRLEVGYDLTVGAAVNTATGDGDRLGAPTFELTWQHRRDEVWWAARGIVGLPTRASSLGLAPGPNPPVYIGETASVLVQDPLIAWSAAYTATLQVSGGWHHEGVVVAAVAGVTDVDQIYESTHQTLLRGDVGLAWSITPCLSLTTETGILSDALDERADEGTDVVGTWSVGVHSQRSAYTVGASFAGGLVGGRMIGPSGMLDLQTGLGAAKHREARRLMPIVADGVAIVASLAAIAAYKIRNEQEGVTVETVPPGTIVFGGLGAAAYLVTPALHVQSGNHQLAAQSLMLRVGAPIAGATLGLLLARDEAGIDNTSLLDNGSVRALFVIGAVLAMVADHALTP